MVDDPYTDLAQSILLWDWATRQGKRADVVQAERRLKNLAGLLEEAGWRIGKVKNETTKK